MKNLFFYFFIVSKLFFFEATRSWIENHCHHLTWHSRAFFLRMMRETVASRRGAKFPLPKSHVFKANIGTFCHVCSTILSPPLNRQLAPFFACMMIWQRKTWKTFSSHNLKIIHKIYVFASSIPLHFSLWLCSHPSSHLSRSFISVASWFFAFIRTQNILCSAINLIWKFQISCWSII